MAESDLNPEFAKFLDRDFTQCFNQMRHYDQQLWDICKFSFTAYTTLIGIAVALYKYSHDTQTNLIPAAIAGLTIGLIVGSMFFALCIRNRVYFVVVTRYINEHRRFFLSAKPLGFENLTQMYTNSKQPPFFNWSSSQAWIIYVIAGLNGVLVACLAYLTLPPSYNWPTSILLFLMAIGFQLRAGISYLRSRDNKSASQAVFGI